MNNNIIFNKTHYDDIIPLGEECYTCMTIDSKFGNLNIRKNAYPFDYVGHSFIDKILDKIKSNTLVENIIIKKFGNKYFFYDNIYGFCYWHDTSHANIEDFTENESNEFIQKYNRRYEKFYKNIHLKIIIISVLHFDKIFKNTNEESKIKKLYNHLKSINNDITLLSFNFYNKNEIFDNYYHYNIEYSKIESDFILSKKNFEYSLKLKILSLF